MMRLFFAIIVSFILCTTANAVTYINNSTTFPYVLSTQNETYELTEDITCGTSCLYVKNTGITIDGKGHTMTFGNSNNPGILNDNFASWADASTPSNWTILSGTATRVTSTWPYKTYDAQLSANSGIKSGTVTLNAGQTYMYFAFIKGNYNDTCTLTVNKASDDSILATQTITGLMDRGFAVSDGSLTTGENRYKPSSNTDVYLKVECSGSYTKRIAFIDIKPEKHIGITHHSYLNTAYFPDALSTYFGSTANNLTIKNLNIVQGLGKSVKAVGMYLQGNAYSGAISNVTVNMSGKNTAALVTYPTGSFLVDNVDTDTTSDANFNRMHAPSGLKITTLNTATGTGEIKNCTILNDPEMGINYSGYGSPATSTFTASINHNTIRQKEQVTEGYAIGVTNVNNMDISYNTIQPYRGRGIISDTSGSALVYGLDIHHNSITDLYESTLFEYTVNSLEPVGIRLRNWGEDPLKGVLIHDNLISGSTDSNGAHGIFGININSYHPNDEILIYNNSINISASGPETYFGAGIAMQIADYSANSIPLLIQNNTITTTGLANGVHLGGVDTAGVEYIRNVDLVSNIISSEADTIKVWSGTYTVDDVNIYCNQLTNTGTSSYPFRLDGTLTNMHVDYNQITNSNSGGYEVYVDSDESSDALFYGNGTINVTGGGSVGTALAATNGSAGCYESAGVSGEDIFAPSTTASPVGGTFTSSQIVSLTCEDNIGCINTYYCIGTGCSPDTTYTSSISISSSSILRFYSEDAINSETIKQETYTINIPEIHTHSAYLDGIGNASLNGVGSLTIQ